MGRAFIMSAPSSEKEIDTTLSAGDTTITINSSAIVPSSIIEVYTTSSGVVADSVTTTNGRADIVFPVQEENIGVKIIIR